MKLEFLKVKLHTQIFMSIILGVFMGILLKENALIFKPIGIIYIRLLSMIIIPIIFSTLIIGATSLGNIKTLGTLGKKTFLYYIATTIIAVLIGITCVNFIQPGNSKDIIKSEKINSSILDKDITFLNFIEEIVPRNIYSAIVEEHMISIIFFTLLIGISLNYIGKSAKPILDLVHSFNTCILKITEWIMHLAPFGVFSLIASLISDIGINAFKSLALYMLSVTIALSIHLWIIIPIILLLFANYSPKKFFIKMFPALATAFSTDSSIATLPVTIESLEKRVGVSNKITSFVAPIGATINMDGTALYEAMAALFIAQVYGIHLSFTEQIIIAITSILASIGAAGIPSAGLVTLVIVLQAVNLPLEGISLLLAVDRVLDMCRTTVNVAGDACGTIVIATIEGEDLSKS